MINGRQVAMLVKYCFNSRSLGVGGRGGEPLQYMRNMCSGIPRPKKLCVCGTSSIERNPAFPFWTVFFPPRWEEEEAGVLAPAVKNSHLEVAGSPV